MLALLNKWQVCRGYGFGLRQPVVVGRMQVDARRCTGLGAHNPSLASLLAAHGLRLGKDASVPVPVPAPGREYDWLMSWALMLQKSAGIAVFEPPRVEVLSEVIEGMTEVRIVAPYTNSSAAISAIRWVVNTVRALSEAATPAALELALQNARTSLGNTHKALLTVGHRGVNIERFLARAAEARMPFALLEGDTYIIGQGHRSRWLQSTFTDATPQIGSAFARRKHQASRVLAAHGLPVAAHRMARSEDEAVRHAEALGYPVVVKPADQDGGRGVHAGLTSAQQVRRCYRDASQHSKLVLVEVFHPGRDYRLTISHGRMIKAIERIPGRIVGDGIHRVRELVDAVAGDADMQRRSGERRKPLLSLDDEAIELLAEAGVALDDVLANGREVRLRRRANVSTGGTTRVVTADVHPDNRRLAERAADALRLDVAGIDLLIADIACSYLESDAIICEVNAQPQLGENGAPGLYLKFLRELVGGDGRVPVVLVLGGTQLAAHPMAWAAAFAGLDAGTAIVSGGALHIDGVRHGAGTADPISQALTALRCRDVHRLFVIAEPADIARHGLPAADVDGIAIVEGPWCATLGPGAAAAMANMISPHVRGPLLCVGQSELGRHLRSVIRDGVDAPLEMDRGRAAVAGFLRSVAAASMSASTALQHPASTMSLAAGEAT